MTIEQPRPPQAPRNSDQQQEVEQLRREVRELQQNITFLKQLLEHVQQELDKTKRNNP